MARKTPAGRTYTINASDPTELQIKRLNELIASPEPTMALIEVSPNLALYILDNINASNRPFKMLQIAKYTSDIEEGLWGVTGDTLKFGSDGQLKDGQNRLSAVTRAEIPIVTWAIFGIDPALFDILDQVKPRTPADALSIAGVKYSNWAAGAIRWWLILTSDNPLDRGATYTPHHIRATYNDKLDKDRLEASVKAAIAVKRTTGHPVGPLAALHYIMAEKHQAKADAFFEEWAVGRAPKGRAKSPTMMLQAKLTELATLTNGRVHENIRNALIVRAWNAYLADAPLTRADLSYQVGEDFPEINQ